MARPLSEISPVDPRAFGLGKAAYTVAETVTILSMSRAAVYAAVRAGQLQSAKQGRKTLFLAPDLVAFLLSLREAA
jgi:hypothetical protein